MLPYQVLIALRYLKSRKRHRSISFNTLITVLGVAVGVAALLIVLSVMSGFHEDLQRKILGVRSHIIVQTYGRIMTEYEAVIQESLKEPHVVSASPFVVGQAMVSFEGIAQGVYMRGVEPLREMETTDIEKHMAMGSLLDLKEDDGDLPGIIIGNELSARLFLLPGDTVKIISPTGGTGPLGMIPRQKKFRVVGIFEIGMFEYDSNLVLTSLGPARQFFSMGEGVNGVELKVDAIYKVSDIAEGLKENLGPNYMVQDWIQMNRSLFAALKLEPR
jgi:lipoprotein-releasing system permease protein